MNLLFADVVPGAHVARLRDAGHTCTVDPGLGPDTLLDAIEGTEVLVVRSTRVPAPVFARADALGLVIRAGAGTNTIDLEAASAAGVFVSNVPGMNAIAVAELAMGLILSLDRRIPESVADLRAGKWRKNEYSRADGLAGKTLGVVGLGEIGLAVAERAGAFGIDVVAVQRAGRSNAITKRAADAGIRFVASDADMLSQADIVSLHVPLNDETRDLVDGDFLAMFRDGTWIINTSRGEVVDEDALLVALDERGMRAGLDVFKDEPASGEAPFTSRLAAHPSVVGTHHIGASTEQAQKAIADNVLAIIEAYAQGVVTNCVNLETRPLGTCSLVVRHRDRVGILSEVLAVLRSAEVNVAQMDNRIFRGAPTAVATIRVSRHVDDHLADELRGLHDVLAVTVNKEE